MQVVQVGSERDTNLRRPEAGGGGGVMRVFMFVTRVVVNESDSHRDKDEKTKRIKQLRLIHIFWKSFDLQTQRICDEIYYEKTRCQRET